MDFPLLPFIGFALAASITPGPNNVMVAAAAANSGMRAVVPHVLGICVGCGVMVPIVGLGLAVPLAAFPVLGVAMRWIGAAWMGVIAWQIATAPPPGEGRPRPPLGFFGAAMFQWINPKGWLIILGIATTWTDQRAPIVPQLMTMAAIFAIVGFPSGMFWAALGEQAGRLLRSPLALRIFNGAMAALLVLSMVPILLAD